MSTAASVTPSRPARITVYRKVGVSVEACSHGTEHEIEYVEVKHLTDTGETREYDNGYTLDNTPLYVDAQGRIYHAHPPIDFYGGVTYRRDAQPGSIDRPHYTGRTPYKAARDLFGRGITPGLPPGPAWSSDLPQPKRRR